jgi:hypothetical protein
VTKTKTMGVSFNENFCACVAPTKSTQKQTHYFERNTQTFNSRKWIIRQIKHKVDFESQFLSGRRFTLKSISNRLRSSLHTHIYYFSSDDERRYFVQTYEFAERVSVA